MHSPLGHTLPDTEMDNRACSEDWEQWNWLSSRQTGERNREDRLLTPGSFKGRGHWMINPVDVPLIAVFF